MCGIAGEHYFKKNKQPPAIDERVLTLLDHRGPDFRAATRRGHTTLYHSRLVIVDRSEASHQPFSDQAHALVYNGEVFNYHALRAQFTNLSTTGDTEVLFRLLKREGVGCLHQLNGFFALAFLDEANNSLLLARDRFGVKPLYYYHDGEKLAFASELKPLMQLIGRQQINPSQLYTYFRLNYCAGPETIFKNVHRLLPGHYIRVANGRVTVDNWYKAGPGTSTDLGTLLDDAVRIRLNADVPVGAFLSGGLDSSIISALAKRHKPDLRTFSIGFGHDSYFDESRYAETVAAHIGSNHQTIVLAEDDFLSHLPHFLRSIDEPFADSSAFNFYMLTRAVAPHVKVALSGDGADELFKGYLKHRALLLSNRPGYRLLTRLIPNTGAGTRDGFIGNKIRQLNKFNILTKLSGTEKQKFLASISEHDECAALFVNNTSTLYFNQLFEPSVVFPGFGAEQTFDLQTVLADDMLVKVDRTSMHFGLEVRNPFLDYRIVELALNLRDDAKINGSGQKLILKKTFGHLLPASIVTRRKKGFELPLQRWLTRQLGPQLDANWLNADKIKQQNILVSETVQKIRNQLNSANPGDSAAKLWAIVVFESWMDNFEEYITP